MTRASSATGRSLVPAVTTTTLPELRPAGRRPGGSGRSGRARCARPRGRPPRRCAAAAGVDPGHQPPLPVPIEGPEDRLDLLGGLALAEDHLGEPAADAAVEVDRGEPAGLLERGRPDRRDGLGRGELARAGPRSSNLRQLV